MKRQIIHSIRGLAHGARNLFLTSVNRPGRPRWLVMMATDRCNSRCKHCNIWQNTPTDNPLTPAEIQKILESPLFQGVEYIINTGGEPTTRGDLRDYFLAQHSALPRATLQLSTNGLLPERAIDLVQFALHNNICLDVGLSLDGVNEKHDFIRGVNGNFKKVDMLLRKLMEIDKQNPEKLNYTVGFTLSALSIPMLEEVNKYLAEGFCMRPFVQWYNESSFYDNVQSNLSGKDEMIQVVESLEPEHVGGLNLKLMWLNWLRGKSIKYRCFAMNTFCVIKCNGDVVPCLKLWDVKAGNIREKSPEEVWRSKGAEEAREIVKNCQGCLNAWSVNWSLTSVFYPYIFSYLRNPRALVKVLK